MEASLYVYTREDEVHIGDRDTHRIMYTNHIGTYLLAHYVGHAYYRLVHPGVP